MEDLTQLLRNLTTQLPSLLVLLTCLVMAIVRWKRHPRVSLVAALAFAYIIFHGLLFSAVYIWLPRLLPSSADPESRQTFYSALALITNFLFAVGLVTLLVAVFVDRKRAAEGA